MEVFKKIKGMAGKQGLEPRFHDPESCVLPIGRLPRRNNL